MGDPHVSVRASATPSGRRPIRRREGIAKSLFAPFYEAMVDNLFEQDSAGMPGCAGRDGVSREPLQLQVPLIR
jgi:hypothetical protein